MNATRLRFGFLLLLLTGVAFGSHPRSPEVVVRPAGGVVALVGGRLVDGTGSPPIDGATVLIEGERIAAVGKDVEIPEGAELVDVSGKTVLPGLIDMHGHLYANIGQPTTLLEPYSRLYLAGGVTTVFSPGDFDPEATIEFRDAQRAGDVLGTRIYTAGPYFTHNKGDGDWMGGVHDAEEARAMFREWEERIDGVKVYTDITPEEFSAVVEEADEVGLRVTGHLGSLSAGQAIDLGIDRLEHGIFAMSEFGIPDPARPFDLEYLWNLAEIDFAEGEGAELIEKIVENDVVIDPTIVIFEVLFSGEAMTEDWQRYLSPRSTQVLKMMADVFGGMRASATDDPAEWKEVVEAFLEKQRELVRRVHEAGGKVVAGTDPVFFEAVPGYALHREVEHLVLAGLTELEALHACTLGAARALDLDGELGSVEVGKLADLVVVDGDPSSDIGDLRKTAMVFQAGTRFSPEELRVSVEGKVE